MRLLVTGGSGRMGRELIPHLERLGWAVLAPTSRAVDILDGEALGRALEQARPDLVLHLAAYTDVARAEREPERCWAVNVIGTRTVAAAAARVGARLIHFSTDYVFDGERGGYREADPPRPSNHYSLTKLVAEEAARQAPGALIVRTSFKDARWPYEMAFSDQFTSADYTDVIADEVALLLAHHDQVRPADGLLHLATERKSVFELARRRNPWVVAGSRLVAPVHIPPDVSLDTGRWQALKTGLGAVGRATV